MPISKKESLVSDYKGSKFLSAKERRVYEAISDDIDAQSLDQYFHLTSNDLALISARDTNSLRLSMALRLCALRWLGRYLGPSDKLPVAAIAHVRRQLGLANTVVASHPIAGQTAKRHRQRIVHHLGYREYDEASDQVKYWLETRVREHDFARAHLDALVKYLQQEKIIRPGLSTLEALFTTIRKRVDDETYKAVVGELSEEQRAHYKTLFDIPSDSTVTQLQWLKEPPPRAQAAVLVAWIQKINLCHKLGADTLKLSDIHPNRIKLMAERARRKSSWDLEDLRSRDQNEADAMVACFLADTLCDLTDHAVEMFSRLIRRVFRNAAKLRLEDLAKREAMIVEVTRQHAVMSDLVLDQNGMADQELRGAILAKISSQLLTETRTYFKSFTETFGKDVYPWLPRFYSSWRVYSVIFLATMRFQSERKDDPLLAGISFMNKANAAASIHWPDAPLKFVPVIWLPHVKNADGEVSPMFYEICLLSELVDAIDTGQIWVQHSRAHISLRSTWIQDKAWTEERKTLVKERPQFDSADRLLKELGDALDERISDVDTRWLEFARDVTIENGELKLKRLEAVNLPPGTKQTAKLIRNTFHKVTLPELLTDVYARTGFADLLTSLNPQTRKIDQLVGRKFAVLMAHGMNIGLQNMANSIKGVTYDELAWVSDWFVREDTLQLALRSMVEAMTTVPITKRWGDGTTSSSDGELFGVMAKALYADINPHAFDIGPAINVYTHLSDNFIPMHSQILPSRTREAAYVLDGYYYHQTDLQIEEHYTDTGGYTDVIFCMCHLDGLLFAPRLRKLAGRRLFTVNKAALRNCNHIGVLFDGSINTKIVKAGYEDLLRLHASVKKGVVTASIAMRSLNLHHPQSALFRAAQEIGRAVKTLYILDYIRDPDLRRRVLIGLNKGESYHSLNRSLCIGYQGLLRSPSIQEQTNQTSSLRLLAIAIMLWNAIHIDSAVTKLRAQGHKITDQQLEHIYPMMLEHINIIGEYRLPTDEVIDQLSQKLRRKS